MAPTRRRRCCVAWPTEVRLHSRPARSAAAGGPPRARGALRRSRVLRAAPSSADRSGDVLVAWNHNDQRHPGPTRRRATTGAASRVRAAIVTAAGRRTGPRSALPQAPTGGDELPARRRGGAPEALRRRGRAIERTAVRAHPRERPARPAACRSRCRRPAWGAPPSCRPVVPARASWRALVSGSASACAAAHRLLETTPPRARPMERGARSSLDRARRGRVHAGRPETAPRRRAGRRSSSAAPRYYAAVRRPGRRFRETLPRRTCSVLRARSAISVSSGAAPSRRWRTSYLPPRTASTTARPGHRFGRPRVVLRRARRAAGTRPPPSDGAAGWRWRGTAVGAAGASLVLGVLGRAARPLPRPRTLGREHARARRARAAPAARRSSPARGLRRRQRRRPPARRSVCARRSRGPTRRRARSAPARPTSRCR